MKDRFSLLVIMILAVCQTDWATVRYTSPQGTDPEGFTMDSPGALRAMVDSLAPGDTLFLMDGQYDQVNTLVINKYAAPDKWVTICAAKAGTGPVNSKSVHSSGVLAAAKPVIDFREQPNGTNGVKVSGAYIHIKDITIRYAGKKGIWLENSSHCILERLDVYGCCDSGIQLRKGGYNVVVNCDSHDNFDYQTNGGNADGFADKQGSAPFPGNTYIACRAWNNSDDGWDSFQRQSKDTPTVYMYCVTYNNAPAEFDISSHPRANGIDRQLPCMEGKDFHHFPNGGNPNGFKLGGQGKEEKASGNYTRHDAELKNCLAVDHRGKGFDQNNNAGRMTISHCLAVDNNINYGFSNPYPCTLDICNCISVEPKSGVHFATAPETNVTQANNSWNEGNSATDHSVEHVQGTILLDGIDLVKTIMADREPNGTLPQPLLEILKNIAIY